MCRRLNSGSSDNPNVISSDAIDKTSTYDQVQDQKQVELPETPNPDLCCMSGCENCIWVEYALKLDQYCAGQGEECLKELDRQIDDPSIRAYIRLQIRQQLAERASEKEQENKPTSSQKVP